MYIDSTNNDPGAGDQPVAIELRALIEPLLLRYEVDLAFWAHHHSYQRSCFVFNEQCQPPSPDKYVAPVHLVIGAAGAGLSRNIEPTPPSWIEVVDDNSYGFVRLHVDATTLSWEFVRSVDSVVLDRSSLSLPLSRRTH